MEFENIEVKEKFFQLHRKYGINHCDLLDSYENKTFTNDDLITLEEDFKIIKSIFDSI